MSTHPMSITTQKSSRKSKRTAKRIKKRSFRRLLMEQLEDRRVLAAVSWTGSGGNLLWSNPANWSTNELPGVEDAVTIDAPGTVTIVYDRTEATTINSLSIADSLRLSAGSIDVIGEFSTTPGTTLTVVGTGVEFAAQGATIIDGTALIVNGGGRLSLPSVTSYAHGPGGNSTVTLRASGSGSILDLSGMQEITGSTGVGQLAIEAQAGGEIDLSSVVEIIDPEVGNGQGRAIRITADGESSLVNLASLQSFQDRTPVTGIGWGPGYSALIARNSGEIAAPVLASLSAVEIQLDGTGTLPIDQITALTNGFLNIIGGDYTFSSLAMIDGTAMVASSGGRLSLPSATSYAHGGGGNSTVTLRSNGQGSLLALSNLQQITGSTGVGQLAIEAQAGGEIDLSGVIEIIDPEVGNGQGRAIRITADGESSLVNLASLQSFQDRTPVTGIGWGPGYSALIARNHGEINAPLLTALTAVQIQLDGSGMLHTGQIKSLTQGLLEVSGGDYQFSSLSMINGTSIIVSGGGRVSLPSATAYAHDQTAGGTLTLRATGSGSVLDLSSLNTINGTTTHQGRVVIDVQLGGEIALGKSLSTSNLEVSIDAQGTLLGGHLILGARTTLNGQGNVFANITNDSGTVSPVGYSTGLIIHGDYFQSEGGILRTAINGTIDSGNYSRLIVTGVASLAGELQITRAGNFVPDLFSDYPVLSAYSVSGAFDTITGNELDGGDIVAVYGSSVVALSRAFDRNPIASFQYENTRGNQRSFLDVRQVNDARSSFRVYSPTGDLVTLSNATPANPDMGDVGVFELPDLGTYEVRVYSPIGTSPTFDAALNYAPLVTQPAQYREIINGEIAVPGATQVWELDVKSGDEINLELQNLVGAGQQLSFTLRTPHGQAVLHRIANQSDFSDVVFPTHIATVEGTYTLTVDGVGDNLAAYQLVVSGSQAPFIRSHAARGPANLESINEAWFQFDQPMDVESFSLTEDLIRFRGPSGDLNATGFSWETPQTLVIIFPDQPSNHELQMILAPSILSAIGIPLDQNDNRVPGEPIADQYAAILRLDRQGPFVIHTEPGAAGSVPMDRLTLHFNEPIDSATFSLADITAFTGPGGTDLRGQLNNYLVRGRSVTVYFETQTTPGAYSITIGPNIADLAGNLMDQSRDGIHGQTNDSFTHNFELRSSNLRVVSVADPQPGTHPTELTFSWQVRNTGNEAATGAWSDYVYLSRDQTWDLDDTVAARVLYDTATRGILQPGEAYNQSVTVSMPGVFPDNYHVIVRSNILRTLPESTFLDNTDISADKALLSLPSLINGVPQTHSVDYRDELFFQYDVTNEEAGGTLLFRLSTSNTEVANELYVSHNGLPTRSIHDVRSQQGLNSEQYIIVPNIREGAYFIRAAIAPNSNAIAALGTATVTASLFVPGDFSIIETNFGQGGTAGNRTIEINGINLDRSITVTLVNSTGIRIAPIRYFRPASDKLYATYDLSSVQPGTYDVLFENSSGRTFTAQNGFEIVRGGGGEFVPSIVAPPAFRRPTPNVAGRFAHLTTFPVTVSWTNAGLNDVRFPIMIFNSNEPFIELDTVANNQPQNFPEPAPRNVASFLATDQHLPSVLMPGSSYVKTYRVLLRMVADAGQTPAYYGIDVLYDEPDEPFNWEGERLGIDPRGLDEAEFIDLYQQFADSIGPTNGDFLEMVSEMAFIVPHSSKEPFEAIRLFTQEAFDRFLAQRTSSIVGEVQYDLFDIDFRSLRITATHSETFETFSAPVQQDGRFTLPNILAGNYESRLDGPAFTTAHLSVNVPTSSPRNLTLPLLRGATVSGTVLTAEGILLPNARLRITSPSLGLTRSITVRPDGSFVAEGLPPATYTLIASATGLETSVQSLTVDLGSSAAVQLRLNRATIVSGIVTGDNGTPLQDAAIRLFRESTDQTMFGFTDEDGRYSINGVSSGSWVATVSHPDFQELTRTVSVAGATATHEFALMRGATVTGRLVTSQSSPVSGAIVTVSWGDTLRTAMVNDSGEFTLGGIPRGSAELRVNAQGFAPLTIDLGEVGASSDIPLGELTITTGRSIAGRILNRSGVPIVGATVMLQSNARNVLTSIPTNSQGAFSFELLELGTYRISIGAPGYVSRTNLLALADSGVNEDFVLEQESVLHGTVNGGVGGTVVLYKGEHPVRWAEIDEQGRYRFFNLLAGEYYATVHHDVELFPTVTVNTTAGQGTQQDFVRLAGSITGIVSEPNGQPIPNATVIASAVNPVTTVRMNRIAITDEAGQYQFVGTEAATVTLTLVAEGFGQTATTAQLTNFANTTVDLAAVQGVSFSGKIVGENGAGIASGTIYLLAEGFDGAIPLTTESNLLGNWRFSHVEPGEYEIIVIADNYVPHIRKVTLTSARSNESIELLVNGSSLGGVVRLDGLAIANATVQISYRGIPLNITQSNSNGEFSVAKLPEGSFTVSVTASNATIFNTEITVPTTTTLDIVQLATETSANVSVLSFAGTTGEAEGSSGGSNRNQERVYPPELTKIRDSVSELKKDLFKLDSFYKKVRSIAWSQIPSSFKEPFQPDCFCNSKDTKEWHSGLVNARRSLHLEALELVKSKIAAGINDEYYRDIGLGSRALATAGIALADHDLEILFGGGFLSVIVTKYNVPLLITTTVASLLARTSAIAFYLGAYEGSIVLMERNKYDFNQSVLKFEKNIKAYENGLESYEEQRRAEKENCQIPNGPLGSSATVPKGVGLSQDLLSPADREALATLTANGVSWYVRVLSNPSGSGLSISALGGAEVGDGDCGNFTIRFEIVLECDDSGFFGYLKKTRTISGVFSLVRTPLEIPIALGCGDRPPENTDCYKYIVTYSGDCGALDPNDILGPVGFGDENWMQPTRRFDYTVRFENDPEEATAPAALVIVTQTLDPSFDFTTFRFGTYGFGDYVFSDAVGLPSHRSRINLTSTIGIFVDVNASFDAQTGEILFELESIDPQTGLIPFNPLMGFLPPNQEGSEGEGFFTYSVFPKAGLTAGTRIDAEAKIYFDANDPIDTPPIFHTIDATPPTSRMVDLPAQVVPDFVVSWLGEDIGSGAVHYDIYVSQDGAPFVRWLERTSLTQSPFPDAVIGSEYSFYSVVTDGVGYREAKIAVAETSTRVVADTANAPVLNDLLTGTYRGRSLVIDLLQQVGSSQSAIDPDSVVIVTDAEHGTVTMLGDGRVRYVATEGFVGEDEIAFTVRDVDGRVSNLAVVSIRVVGSPSQNPLNFSDVNDDGDVHPLDALMVLVRLAQAQRDGVTGGLLAATVADELPQRFYDVDGNGRIEPLDALMVLTQIARNNRSGSSEGESWLSETLATPTITVAPPSPRENRNDDESANDRTSLSLPRELADEETTKFAAFDWADDEWSAIESAVAEAHENQAGDTDNERDLADAIWGQRMLSW